MKDKTRALAQGALLCALALALSYAERFIPLGLLIPLPGVKLGLANIVTLFALYRLGTRSALLILLVRICLGALFGGGVSGFLFSLFGGLLAFCGMCVLMRSARVSVFGVSICGAALHNIGQIFAAMLLLSTPGVVLYLPPLLLVSLLSGTLTATAAIGPLRALAHIDLHRT